MKVFLSILFLPFLAWSYEFDLAVVLLFQNEARHLKEWIEYHKLVGVQHFYLYNNLSEDHYLDVIEPYIRAGEIELFDVPTRTLNQPDNLKVQCEVYNDALNRTRGRVKWLAFIDGDEYLVPLEQDSLLDLLKDYEGFGGVHASWLNFGTSHIDNIPEDKLRIEILLHCDVAPAELGKSIVRPERVEKSTDPHVYYYLPPYYHVNSIFQRFAWHSIPSRKRLMVYHYYTGDIDHLINIKFPRRILWYPHLKLDTYLEEVERYNRRYNPTMLRFVPAVRKAVFHSLSGTVSPLNGFLQVPQICYRLALPSYFILFA